MNDVIIPQFAIDAAAKHGYGLESIKPLLMRDLDGNETQVYTWPAPPVPCPGLRLVPSDEDPNERVLKFFADKVEEDERRLAEHKRQ